MLRCLGAFIISLGLNAEPFSFKPGYLYEAKTWLVGIVALIACGVVWLFSSNNLDLLLGTGKGLLGKHGKVDVVEGSLENSRFLTTINNLRI